MARKLRYLRRRRPYLWNVQAEILADFRELSSQPRKVIAPMAKWKMKAPRRKGFDDTRHEKIVVTTALCVIASLVLGAVQMISAVMVGVRARAASQSVATAIGRALVAHVEGEAISSTSAQPSRIETRGLKSRQQNP